ncbi:MAG: hypothetical protein WAN46_12400 [Gammaproteobacteria bacterium]|jgi:hypothetical protein
MADDHQREQAEILEQGNIYFVYRPKVKGTDEVDTVGGLEDVQRTYMVLSPHGKKRFRLLALGQKQLPAISGSEKNWGFVDKVENSAKKIEEELQRDSYQTKTRDERIRPAARPAGEGVYALVRHGNHTHLTYALELPVQTGAVQKALHIEEEGSYVLSIKNPEQPSDGQAGLSEKHKVTFPRHLQDCFRERRFIPVDPPDLLDYEGAELLFIGAAEDIPKELGISLEPQQETESTAEIFRELHMAKSRHPIKPLFEGRWE